jgi:hypothetical protein
MTDPRPAVTLMPPARFQWHVERITDTAGCRLTGGSGASCWGYNQSNIVRCEDDIYALSWRDDLTVTVFRRLSDGRWEAGPVLPPVPQNGNLLLDSTGRLHVISGDRASWHVRFDEPGRLDRFELRRRVAADSRFGASIDSKDRILVCGGLDRLGWYVLDGNQDFQMAASGQVTNEKARGYHFVIFHDGAAHTFCSDDYFLPGEQFPNQQVKILDPKTGEPRAIETQRGIYPVLRTYYYHNRDLLAHPDRWEVTVLSDVSDTFKSPPDGDGSRGTVDQQDFFLDSEGILHFIYYENRQPSREVWAGTGQDASDSRLYHAVGRPGGPFQTWRLGAFNSGRLYQTPDGRMHYFLTFGRRSAAESLWHAVSEPGQWDRISQPVQLDTGGGFWHFFTGMRRAGSAVSDSIDGYWTGPIGGNSNEVFYGRLTT